MFPKNFDVIVTNRLSEFLIDKIIVEQHGFIKNKSTLSNLLVYTNFITQTFTDLQQVDSIYLDFSKAYDSVNHTLLVNKAKCMGLGGSILQWLGSYLSNRIQVVKIRNELSTEINILPGEPQGSHLGPLLFSIYVNDISDVIKFSNLVIYADDVKIFNVINSSMDCSKIQEDLNYVFAWACSNGLKLNIKKCNSISFTYNRQPSCYDYKINNTSLSRVYEIKDIGIILDSNLNFENHIN